MPKRKFKRLVKLADLDESTAEVSDGDENRQTGRSDKQVLQEASSLLFEQRDRIRETKNMSPRELVDDLRLIGALKHIRDSVPDNESIKCDNLVDRLMENPKIKAVHIFGTSVQAERGNLETTDLTLGLSERVIQKKEHIKAMKPRKAAAKPLEQDEILRRQGNRVGV